MIRNAWIALAAGTAVALAAPAAAQGQSGTQAPPAAQASPTAQGPAAVPAQTNSQAPTNASPTGVENASENSVLATDDAATQADSDTKSTKKAETVTRVRAGPNAGMIIGGKKAKKADTDEAAKPEKEKKEDPQL